MKGNGVQIQANILTNVCTNTQKNKQGYFTCHKTHGSNKAVILLPANMTPIGMLACIHWPFADFS